MQTEYCQIEGHDEEELLYVCNELQCIDLNKNKLICQKCLCVHRGVSYNRLKEKASNNYNQYIQMLKNDIEENEALKKNVELSFEEIKNKIQKMLSNIQKNIYTFVDQQSQRLQTNQTKAEQFMQDQNPSLDIFIFFAKFSDKIAKGKQETTKQQVKAIVNDLLDDLNQKIEYLKQPDVNEYKIIEFELQSFKIESIFQKKLPFSYCYEHCSNNTSICINSKCLESNNLDYYCLRCCKVTHVEDFTNDCLVEYEKLKKEQRKKQQLLVKQKLQIKVNVQQLVNNLINQLKLEQKEQYQQYEIAISNIKNLEQQFEVNLSVQDNKYVFGDLILQFITTSQEKIETQLNHVQQSFEDNLKLCKMDKKIFLENCGFLQQKQDENLKLLLQLQELEESSIQKDLLIKNQSSENILNQILTSVQEIKEKNEILNLQKTNQGKSQIILLSNNSDEKFKVEK